MRWLRSIFRDGGEEREAQLRAVQEKFSSFLALLGKNNQVLKVIGDLEEKSQGEHLFDVNYIRQSARELREGVAGIVENMIALGGEAYHPLRERYAAIDTELEAIVEGRRPIQEDAYTIAFDELGRERATSVGSKNAQLGELRAKLGLPVPDGFAITAWAYKRFVDANDLQSRITAAIRSLDIKRYEDLVRVSESIRSLVSSSPVPQDLADAIRESYEQLVARSPAERFSLRSSAIGEDTSVSFAGQYSTFLNVSADELLDRYREVVASKFTPKAIYYFLEPRALGVGPGDERGLRGHGRRRRERRRLHTGPGAAGRGPRAGQLDLRPRTVPGQRAADAGLLPRRPRRARARIGLGGESPFASCCGARRGVSRSRCPPERAGVPVAHRAAAGVLAELRGQDRVALRLSPGYRVGPRPRAVSSSCFRPGLCGWSSSRPSAELPDLSGLETIRSGRRDRVPGAGDGPVHHVTSPADLADVPQGAVVVSTSPFPGLITVMGQAERPRDRGRRGREPHGHAGRESSGSPRSPAWSGASRAPAAPAGHGRCDGRLDLRRRASGAGGRPPARVRAVRGHGDLRRCSTTCSRKVSPLNLLHPADQGFRARGLPDLPRHHPLRPPEGDGGDVLRGERGRGARAGSGCG